MGNTAQHCRLGLFQDSDFAGGFEVSDAFQARLNKRRATKVTIKAEPLSRDVIELKQAALWHGGKTRIDQACEAAAEGVARQPNASRIPFRSEGISSSSVPHQERATSPQTSHPPSCASSSSAAELPRTSGGTCKEQRPTDASDSSLCGSNCASRLERASGSSRKVSRRKGNFPVAAIPVADISRSHSFCGPVMSDVSGRDSREEIAGSTGDEGSTPLGESGTTGCQEDRKIPQPETLADSDTSNHRPRSGAIQTTTNRRLGNAGFGLSAPHRTEGVSGERIPGVDDVSVMWSPLESKDGRGRHSGEDGIDNGTTSVDTSLSRMCINDATTTDDKQNGDILWMQSVSPVQKSGAHISYYGITCFAVYALMLSSSAHGGAGDYIGLRFGGIGRELQNVDRTSRITTGTTILTGTATASFVFSKVSVSSCFLMEIDKGCLQPSVFDDSIFGDYFGTLVKNAAGAWEHAVKTDVRQKICRVLGKSPWWDLSCTMMFGSMSKPPWLAQIQSAHDELRCYFADHKTMQIRPASNIRLDCEKQNLPLGPPRRAKPRARSNSPTHKEHATIHVDSTTQR